MHRCAIRYLDLLDDLAREAEAKGEHDVALEWRHRAAGSWLVSATAITVPDAVLKTS